MPESPAPTMTTSATESRFTTSAEVIDRSVGLSRLGFEPVAPELSSDFLEQVRARIGRFRRRAVDEPELKPAAVAVVLLPNRPGQPSFLLTRRTATLQRHAGQWALPGGRRDTGESAAETAVRELWEELGVPASRLLQLGMLDDYVTRS